ncbi:hypothetical protein T492DRAFT_1094309 [Pavlovales sp. CCMP2436]|nr:hypothetical protein T492DRAFT_1094309 [Pavlovales sp. CCMP2436]
MVASRGSAAAFALGTASLLLAATFVLVSKDAASSPAFGKADRATEPTTPEPQENLGSDDDNKAERATKPRVDRDVDDKPRQPNLSKQEQEALVYYALQDSHPTLGAKEGSKAPPTFCSRDPPAKDNHKGFTCMEKACWTGPDGDKVPKLARDVGFTDPWGAEFFSCMCVLCKIQCKMSDSCNSTYIPGPPNYSIGWPWH